MNQRFLEGALKGDLVQFPYSVQQLPLRRCPTSGRLGTSEISFLETLDLLRRMQPVCWCSQSVATLTALQTLEARWHASLSQASSQPKPLLPLFTCETVSSWFPTTRIALLPELGKDIADSISDGRDLKIRFHLSPFPFFSTFELNDVLGKHSEVHGDLRAPI